MRPRIRPARIRLATIRLATIRPATIRPATVAIVLAGRLAFTAGCADNGESHDARIGDARIDDARIDDARSGDGGADGAIAADAPGPGATVTECLADVAPAGAPFVNVLEFADDAGTLQLGIARRPGQRTAVGETFPYDLVRFGLTRDGVNHCVTDAAALSYDFGHHNWNDVAEARIGAERYRLTLVYDLTGTAAAWRTELQAVDPASGQQLWGPVAVHETRCRSVPLEDLNGCLLW